MSDDKIKILKELITNVVRANADKNVTDGRYGHIHRFSTIIGDEELTIVGYDLPYRNNSEMSYSQTHITTRHLDIDTDTLSVSLDYRVQSTEYDADKRLAGFRQLQMTQALMKPGVLSKAFLEAQVNERVIITNSLKNVLNEVHKLTTFTTENGDNLFMGRLIEVPEGSAVYLSLSARTDNRPFVTFKMPLRLYYSWFMGEDNVDSI